MRGNILIKLTVELSRIIVGATFVFSGFVKAVDPHGSEYKIQDYLISLGLPQLFPAALGLAVFLCVAELLMGLFLLLGIYRKWTSRSALIFMAFMTPLTLWIALKNPVKDCGCFGDAFIISNWATFYKNIVLLACVILLTLFWRNLKPVFSAKTMWMAGLFSVLFGFGLAIYNVMNRPVLDFRPYKIGSNIPAKMYIDPSKADVFENVFVYEQDGVKKEFTEDNYPWNDSTWTFVDMTTKLVKEGEKPEIEDFDIVKLDKGDGEGENITQTVLADSGYTFLAVSYGIQGVSPKEAGRLKTVAGYAKQQRYPFYCLTSSSAKEIATWEQKNNSGFVFCHSDERMLKTMIRSNPGLVLLKNGTVINKWDSNSLPAEKELRAPLNELRLGQISNERKNNMRRIAVIISLFIVPLAAIKWHDRKSTKK